MISEFWSDRYRRGERPSYTNRKIPRELLHYCVQLQPATPTQQDKGKNENNFPIGTPNSHCWIQKMQSACHLGHHRYVCVMTGGLYAMGGRGGGGSYVAPRGEQTLSVQRRSHDLRWLPSQHWRDELDAFRSRIHVGSSSR